MMVLSLGDVQNGFAYLAANPQYLLRCILNAAKLRVGVPLEAVHWLLEKVAKGKLPRDMRLAATTPPALDVSATVPAMGAKLAVTAQITVEQILLGVGSLRVQLRVRELGIRPQGESPMAQMLAMMDLSKPGDLLNFMPVRPPVILDAQGDMFVLDLMKLPKLARNPLSARIVSALSEVLAIRELSTEDGLVVLGFRPMPLGILAAIGHLKD